MTIDCFHMYMYVHNVQDAQSAGATLLLQSMEEIAVSFAYNIPSNNGTTSSENQNVEAVFSSTRMSKSFIWRTGKCYNLLSFEHTLFRIIHCDMMCMLLHL